VRVVADETGLAALWPDWDALWQRATTRSPFTAAAWLRPWWRVFGTGAPMVGVLDGPCGPCGLLPLYRRADKLLPIGVGISDAFDILLAPEAPQGATDRLLAGVLGAATTARCDLPELPPEARLRSANPPPGWRAEFWQGPDSPVLSLQPEPQIPKAMRRDLRQAQNRAMRAGGWTVERATAATWPALFDDLVALHTARWRMREEAGVLADPRVLSFHCAAAPGLLAAGLLRLEVLRLRGQVAGAIHALLSPGRIAFYLAGFDPACAFESPGTILLGHMIAEAAREGRAEAHFLRGDEAYKRAWGGVESRNQGLGFRRL
jgi:CelD/BcsL family acetyltransferase involved in cellulose biosynthesis